MNDSVPQKIRLSGALRLGCLTGLLTACGPAFICSLAFNRLVHTLRHWMLGWKGPDAELSIGALLGGTAVKVSLDMQEHLKVTSFMRTLQTLESGWWWTIPLLTLLLTLLGGVLVMMLAGIGAGLYNWIGRHSWLAPDPAQRRVNQPAYRPAAWLSLPADPARRWPVRQGVTRIGSDPSSDTPLPSGAASHAEIRYEQGRYVLYDLSGGQTWVQDRQVTGRNMIKDGFRLRFGDVDMIFRSE